MKIPTFALTIPETATTRAILISLGRRDKDNKPSICFVAYSKDTPGFAMLMLTAWRQPANGRHVGFVVSSGAPR